MKPLRPWTLAGHPVHPQLVGLPIGMLSFSFAMDLLYHVTGRRSFAEAAYYSMVGGSTAALAAGTAGAADYTNIPNNTHSKQLANTHAILNLSAVALYTTSIALRQRSPSHTPGLLATLLNGTCFAGLLVSQWYGGHLVYDQAMRVNTSGKEEGEIRPPGDEKMERSLDRLANLMPARGPASPEG